MKHLSDKRIIESWENNVYPWVTAIKEGEITSRVLVTNKAIYNTITKRNPKKLLDLGCGEGWLVRELEKTGVDSLGTDVIPEFIEYARKEGKGRYKVLPYEKLSPDELNEKFDIVVCNFSLLGKESVEHVFQQAPLLLNKGGAFIIQTIHPITATDANKYEDGWREGTWKGFSDKFTNPAPWYFRTLSSWNSLFHQNGFTLSSIEEPINPTTKTIASIIFTGELNQI